MSGNCLVLIADDEAPARIRVRDLLAGQAHYSVVAESDSGTSTLQAIRTTAPDLLILDVQMPGLTGLEVMARLQPDERPLTIFTTAFDRYALDAFDASAIDYLLKPFTDERFVEALGRAETYRRGKAFGDWHGRLRKLLDDIPEPAPAGSDVTPSSHEPLERFACREDDRIVLIDAGDVQWIEASRDHLRLHVGKVQHLVRMTMNEAERRLDPRQFVRIHRSLIVRISDIAALQPYSGSEDIAVLRTAARLPVSRHYRQELRRRLGME